MAQEQAVVLVQEPVTVQDKAEWEAEWAEASEESLNKKRYFLKNKKSGLGHFFYLQK